ncbi:hypothetical protein AB0J52_22000 [Spirillospora sp. NPDC049652]
MRASRWPVRVMAGLAAGVLLAAGAGCGKPAARTQPETGATPGPPTVAPSGAPGSGPSGDASPGVTEVRVSVVKGRVVTASRTVKVRRGATVRITVTSDVPEEFHLHGYDRELELAPGRPASLRLVASLPGVFEAEMHHSGARAFELQVG